MQRFVLNTDLIRPAERHDWWVGEVEDRIGITAGPVGDQHFWGRLDVQALSPMTFLAFEARNNLAQRLGPQIRRLEWGQYFVYREMSTGGLFELGGREFATGHGDLLIYDADARFKAQSTSDYRHHIWTLPKATVDPHLPRLPRPLALHIPVAANAGALAVAYIEALAGNLGALTATQAAMVADNLGRLIAIVCGGAARAHVDAVRQAKLEQAKQYVAQRLTTPELSAERVADDLSISVRQLHMLFEGGDESFSAYVRRLRLERARRLLQSPEHLAQSVTDIAFGAGFASLPTFYRAFSAAFDAAPGDLRPRLIRP